MRRPAAVDVLVAAVAGAASSGAPSTAHALATGGHPLEAARAAGTLVVPSASSTPALLVGAGVAHGAISLWWAAVLAVVLPRRGTAAWGAAAGIAIAALDLGVIGRRIPAIRALAVGPQVADHVAFGVVVGAVLARRRACAPAHVAAITAVPRRTRRTITIAV